MREDLLIYFSYEKCDRKMMRLRKKSMHDVAICDSSKTIDEGQKCVSVLSLSKVASNRSLRAHNKIAQMFELSRAKWLSSDIRRMIMCVDILEQHNLIGHLLDHKINTNEKVLDTLGVTTVLTSQSDEASVVDVQCCGVPLWEA